MEFKLGQTFISKHSGLRYQLTKIIPVYDMRDKYSLNLYELDRFSCIDENELISDYYIVMDKYYDN